MYTQWPKFNKAFATTATPVSVVVCVIADNVFHYATPICEPGRTEGAAVWPLSRVRSEVDGEVVPFSEPGLAHMAPVVLHTIVGLHVSLVVHYIFKRGTASFTLMDHLPCVDPFVFRQVATRCERFPAEITHVRPVPTVCPAVSRQITQHSKGLATVVTPERSFPRVCSVM